MNLIMNYLRGHIIIIVKFENKKFNIKVCDYKIKKQEDDTYIITLIEDMIITGKTNSSKETIYKIEGILKNEINIVS